MPRRFLGMMVAGSAAIAGALLLVATPGASAATVPDAGHDKGCILTYPKFAKPGDTVKLAAKCAEPQEHPWVWSKVTGRVSLEPWMSHARPIPGADGDAARPRPPRSSDHEKVVSGEENRPEDTGEGGWWDRGTVPDDAMSHDRRSGRRYVYWVLVRIPDDAMPGHYWLKGSGGYGKLVVAPNGWIEGGDGGSGTNAGLAAGGASALAAAAIGGLALMRRRRPPELNGPGTPARR
jgi:hypothetical protein